MIIRVGQATIRPGKRAAFEHLLHKVVVPRMRQQPGILALHVGHGVARGSREYVVVSVWWDLQDIKAYAGERWTEPVIPPGGEALVTECWVRHFKDPAWEGASQGK